MQKFDLHEDILMHVYFLLFSLVLCRYSSECKVAALYLCKGFLYVHFEPKPIRKITPFTHRDVTITACFHFNLIKSVSIYNEYSLKIILSVQRTLCCTEL